MFTLGIIIPAYNYADQLEPAVLSALACSNNDIDLRLIVIDDGSTDHTKEVVQDLQAAGHAFKYLYQNNTGPAAARNRGIENSDAEFLIFLDADDELCPAGVKQGVAAIIDQPDAELLIAGHNSISESKVKYVSPGSISKHCEINFRRYLIEKKITLSSGAMIIRRESIANIRFPELLRNSEDISFFAQILARLRTISIDTAMVNINKHSDSLRHNMVYADQVGEQVVEQIFAGSTLPSWTKKYEKPYRSQRLLSLFRSHYLAGDKDKARSLYRKALSQKLTILFKWAYLKKYIRLILS